MNVIGYLTSLFRGQNLNGELESVRQAARQDAQLVAGTYVQEFESETARILMASQQRLACCESEEDVEDADYTVADPYEGWSRPDLIAQAKENGVTVERSDTKESLKAKLTERQY